MGVPRIDRTDRFFVLWDGVDGAVEVLGYSITPAAAWADAAHTFYCYHVGKGRFLDYNNAKLGSRWLREICEREKIFLKLASIAWSVPA